MDFGAPSLLTHPSIKVQVFGYILHLIIEILKY